MKNIIPQNSKYVPLTQQKWCCVPTCIQMVMLRRNLPLISAELIGHHLGLVVPKEALKYFWNAKTGPRPPAGYGTQIGNPQFDPNIAYQKLNLPLRLNLKLIDQFKSKADFRQYLNNLDQDKKDYLVCFDWPTLFDPDEIDRWGHVCVLDKVDLNKDQIRIIDPSANSTKWLYVDISKMYEAMKEHAKRAKSSGFWEFEVIN